MNNWFNVDTEGLKALQKGKPKTFIVRELVQNTWDENITTCEIKIERSCKKDDTLTVVVQDDSPEGFKNITDAYTLFRDTSKRKDAEKRGRYNLGDKQVIAICDSATIMSTKGTIHFDKEGRTESETHTEHGTIVTIDLPGTKKECEEMIEYARALLVPPKIKFVVNGEVIPARVPYKKFDATLLTEIQTNGFMKTSKRKTTVHLIKEASPKLYEMGLPVMDIDCQYGLDVQQKVPLSFDRDSVNQAFLKDLYMETLNHIYMEITPEHSSDSWIRLGMSGKGILPVAIKQILVARYGEKFLVANRFDKNSIDEATARGYRVIAGSELSKEEWANIRENQLMASTSDLFGMDILEAAPIVEPDVNQKAAAEYAKRIAKRFLHCDITVKFVKGLANMPIAQYGKHCLTFNVSRLGGFFNKPISVATTDLVLHELGHEAGNHTEHEYHSLLTRLGAELTMLALTEPGFFEVSA